MNTENILYTDGHEVTVTDSTFRVRKHSYRLEGIIRYGFSIIRPSKIPAFLLTGLGLLSLALGISNLRPDISFTYSISGFTLNQNTLLVILGIASIAIGSLVVILSKERYGLKIATAQGERNVIVSERREYISMIVDALNKAYIKAVGAGKIESRTPSLKMNVSHR